MRTRRKCKIDPVGLSVENEVNWLKAEGGRCFCEHGHELSVFKKYVTLRPTERLQQHEGRPCATCSVLSQSRCLLITVCRSGGDHTHFATFCPLYPHHSEE